MGLLQSWGGVGTSLASFIFIWEMIHRYCPPELVRAFDKWTQSIRSFFNPYIQISISEYISNNFKRHDAYAAVEAYLGEHSAKQATRLRAEAVSGGSKLVLSMDENESFTDEFRGTKIQWIKHVQSESRHVSELEKRSYKLMFHKKYRDMVTDIYLEQVIKRGKELQKRNRKKKLYTNGHSKSMWSHITFEHPATFGSLAMEAERKQEIMDDLLQFRENKDFYARTGKAWKRGYLLYGPPGTGKSTMIAAMANLLDYDIYDLELTSADVAENLMPSSPKEGAEKCLLKLVEALKHAKELMIKKDKEESVVNKRSQVADQDDTGTAICHVRVLEK